MTVLASGRSACTADQEGLWKHDGSGNRIAVARADGAATERDREALPRRAKAEIS